MSAELWQTLGTIVVLLIVGGYNGWRAKRAEDAARVSQKVVRNIDDAVGNGFGRDVVDRLTRLEERACETRDLTVKTHDLMVEHLSEHSRQSMRRKD